MKLLKPSLNLILVLLSFTALSQVSKSSNEKKFSIGVAFSPDYSFRRLHSKNEESDFLKDTRNQFESAKFGYTTGLVAKYRLNRRLALESGLKLSDKGEKYVMRKEDFVFVDGLSIEDDPSSPEKYKTNYHFYYLGLPVKLNYIFLDRKVSLFVSAGFSTDLFLEGKQSSVFHFEDRTEESSFSMEGDYNKITFSGLAGVGMETQISERIHIRIEPIFRYSFTPLIDIPLKEYLYSVGGNLTLFYN